MGPRRQYFTRHRGGFKCKILEEKKTTQKRKLACAIYKEEYGPLGPQGHFSTTDMDCLLSAIATAIYTSPKGRPKGTVMTPECHHCLFVPVVPQPQNERWLSTKGPRKKKKRDVVFPLCAWFCLHSCRTSKSPVLQRGKKWTLSFNLAPRCGGRCFPSTIKLLPRGVGGWFSGSFGLILPTVPMHRKQFQPARDTNTDNCLPHGGYTSSC